VSPAHTTAFLGVANARAGSSNYAELTEPCILRAHDYEHVTEPQNSDLDWSSPSGQVYSIGPLDGYGRAAQFDTFLLDLI
jgi:hypothetical protein